METTPRQVIVLGAGITGLTAAWALSRSPNYRVALLEKEAAVGGLAGTFSRNGFSFDSGSHRLHEGYLPEVDALVKDLCGDDLLRRDRRGQIHLGGTWLPYPPSAGQILFAFGLGDAWRFLRDFAGARLRRRSAPAENFEDFTTARVGRSLYERFYKPYALKLYGISPREIAKDPAVSRVRKFTLGSLWKDFRRALSQGRPTYLYPAQGIGQLARVLQERFLANGGQLHFISRIDGLTIHEDRAIQAVGFTTNSGQAQRLEADVVVSTLPLDVLHHQVVLEADQAGRPAFDLRWRGLRLLYLITPDKAPSEHETFYFPEPEILCGRVSELNKYSPALNQDPGRSVLTIEIPCSPGDALWTMPDDQLAHQCVAELQRIGLLRAPSSGQDAFFSRRVPNVYPVYELGWRERFNKVFERLDRLENLYLLGRTALFLHCNIDHCMAMALKLARHLADWPRSKDSWRALQQEFFNYRVHE